MGNNLWHSVWENRDINLDSFKEESLLSKLIKADGFDSPTGKISESSWLKHSKKIKRLLGINSDSSLYEVGMGAGAFLYPFYNTVKKVGGIDYSQSLIKVAKKVMPEGEFINGDAITMDKKIKYDFVLSNSVFFYFPSFKYSMDILEMMYEKANSKIAILEVSNLEFIKTAEKIRKKSLNENEYKEKYKDFKHLYFPKEFFINFARDKNCSINIFNPNIDGYNANKYRFCVIIDKNKNFNE